MMPPKAGIGTEQNLSRKMVLPMAPFRAASAREEPDALMTPFNRPTSLLTIATILVLAIMLLFVIYRLTSDRTSTPYASDAAQARCAVARQALDAFDAGKSPPAEWIQDRDAAATAVRECDER